MNNIKKFFLILIVIKTSFSIIPIWNFRASSINLFAKNNSYSYKIVDRNLHKANFQLYREFYVDEKNNIIQVNKIYLGREEESQLLPYGEPDFDDIESAYQDSRGDFIVCPKGKFHPYVYYYNSQTPQKREPNSDSFKKEVDWDLKCYYQQNENVFFVSYLNSENYVYEFHFWDKYFLKDLDNLNGIYGFKWRISGNPKDMYALEKEGNILYLKIYEINVQSNNNKKTQVNKRKLVDLKKKYLGFFRNDNSAFCFINYNDKNASDFESGYCNKDLDPNIVLDRNSFENIEINISQKSPFEFFEDVTINNISFIYDTKYVYYNISINNEINKFYYGVIDITLNKVVFNTNENLLVFKPYSDFSMLAITNESLYEICLIRNGDKCLDSCGDSKQPTFDSTGYNNCENKCESNIFLMPDNICIKECDLKLFTLENYNQCWLCKDLNKGEKKFKVINYPGCLENMPNNSVFVNEQFFLIDCIKGYHYSQVEQQCIPDICHQNCNTCRAFSKNDTEQKCLSCKNEKLLENENCVDECSIGFFLEEKNCKKCNDICKACNQNENMCIECEDGKYLDKSSEMHTCKKCSENCLTCSDGEDGEIKNCLLCNQSSDFKFFFNKTCWERCPDNMSFSDNNECYYEREENDLPKKDLVMLCIFIVITSIILLIIIICFYKSLCYKGNKEGQNLIDEINKELIEKDLTE